MQCGDCLKWNVWLLLSNDFIQGHLVRVKHDACQCSGSQKSKKNENRGKFLNFAEIGGRICNIHNWLRGWMPLILL